MAYRQCHFRYGIERQDEPAVAITGDGHPDGSEAGE